MKKTYKPSFKSFVSSLIWDFSLAIAGILGYHFSVDQSTAKFKVWFLFISLCVLCGISLILFTQTIYVFTRRIIIDDERISLSGISGTKTMRFDFVMNATLNERINQISRTDHLLKIVDRKGEVLIINPSTLSRSDEKDFIAFIGSRINLEVINDKPTF
jgi:hypothetical protein